MPDSLRQQLVNAVVATLSTVPAFKLVATWRIAPVNESDLPCVVVRDLTEEHDLVSKTGGVQLNKLLIQVEIGVRGSGTEAADELRILFSQVWTAIAQDIEWGGIADSTRPLSTRIAMEQETMRIAGGIIQFLIVYASQAFDAYQ